MTTVPHHALVGSSGRPVPKGGVPHTVDEYTGGEFDGAAASQARTGGGGAALPARPVSRQRREKLGVEGGRSSPRQTAMFNIVWAGSRVL